MSKPQPLNPAEEAPTDAQHMGVSGTTLSGPALFAVRVVWLFVALLSAGFLLSTLPANFSYFSTSCAEPHCDWGQIAGAQAGLSGGEAGSLAPYAAYMCGLVLFFALVHFVVAAVIAARKSNDWMALLVALFLVTWGATFISTPVSNAAPGPYLSTAASILLGLFLYMFPNGRFVPRWAAVFAAIWVTFQALGALFPSQSISPNNWPEVVRVSLTIAFFATMLLAQIYRYRHVSSAAQRQQTKWVVYGIAMALVGFVIMVGMFQAVRDQLPTSPITSALFNSLFYVPWFFLPVSISVAILRSRLYDIELIINRTLVYGLLTVSLALLYFGGVLLLESLLRPLAGEGHNAFAIVAATLGIAALFNPLRTRLQRAIDRRFYRRKYDANRTLAIFGERLRERLDLSELMLSLEQVVDDTMQPAHVSLWVRAQTKSEAKE